MEDAQRLVEKLKADIQDGKSDDEIFQTYFSFSEKDRQIDGKGIELLTTIPHVTIANILNRLLQVSEEKNVRKIIKRSLYRLKSKGFDVEAVPHDRGKSILHPLQSEPSQGFGSSIDFLGNRLLLLALSHKGRGWRVMQGVISDIQGLVDFSGEEMTRKGYKGLFQEIQGKSPFPLVELDPSYVGFLFAQAYQITLGKKGTPPQDYLHFKTEIESVKKEYERPLVYAYLETEELVENDRILMRTGDLLKVDLFSSWLIKKDRIQPYADAVWEAEESKIVLTQIQKEARFQEIYQKALFELFPEEKRFLYKRRLEEMAYVLFKLERQEEAKTSLSAAIDLEKPMNPIQPNPFLLQLVIKSIFTLLKEAYDQKTKEPSFLIKP
jgi:hypothetical protein